MRKETLKDRDRDRVSDKKREKQTMHINPSKKNIRIHTRKQHAIKLTERKLNTVNSHCIPK